ncbi:hypothetical protein MHBO_001522 [Bonamia ostreae]|uniref:PNPLA domain-containing protein n=1 Tax=Bonamia ostreae TaxID=126728 RepID=A0ABV2AJ77_9EUKA
MVTEIKNSEDITKQRKIKFFEKIISDNGETAICLSGGAKLSFFHIGLILELVKTDLLPNIISGTSGGAISAAFICVRSNSEIVQMKNETNILKDIFQTSLARVARKNGSLLEKENFTKRIKELCLGNTTFKEAYRKTGKVLNIPATKLNSNKDPVMLNYRNSPDVCIWSAVMASTALPKVLPPGELFVKRQNGSIEPYNSLGKLWLDGSYQSDVPLRQLREKFNVTYTIVSQTNPHVAPFALQNTGSGGEPPEHRSGNGLKGGFVLSALEIFLRIEMRKWIIVLQKLGIVPLLGGYVS